jgi:uncharacterized protein YqhQ
MGDKIHRTMVGGQAVIEGVMMRGPRDTALAVRKPDGTINLDVWQTSSVHDRFPILGIPIVRGVVNFIEMLVFGYKTLMKSAEIAGFDEEKTDSASKGSAAPIEGSSGDMSQTVENEGGIGNMAMGALSALSMFLGFAIAILLFVVAPTFLVGKTNQFVHWGAFETLVEGVIKIVIFVGYLALISRMKDIQRLYQYHGAEHKTIYCYEHGDELTPENARKYTRFHPRCGTSFLLIVLIVNIIVFSFVTWKILWLRILLTLVLMPVVVGISYEIIKFAGRHDNSVMRFVLAPGLWLQRLTTREPDDSQLEVAIMSIKAVITDNPNDDRW